MKRVQSEMQQFIPAESTWTQPSSVPRENHWQQTEKIALDFTEHTIKSWRQIKIDQNLTGDLDVALFLIKLYEKSRGGELSLMLCSSCNKVLPDFPTLCATCIMHSEQVEGFSESLDCGSAITAHGESEQDSADCQPCGQLPVQTFQPEFQIDNTKNLFEENDNDQQIAIHSSHAVPPDSLQRTSDEDKLCSESAQSNSVCKNCNEVSTTTETSNIHCNSCSPQVSKKKYVETAESSAMEKTFKQNHSKRKKVTVTDGEFKRQTNKLSSRNTAHLVKFDQTNLNRKPVKRKRTSRISGNKDCEDKYAEFKCEECKVSFSSQDSLLQHMLQTHVDNGGRPFQCQACDASFRTASHLKTHVRSHNSSSFFQCEYCGLSCSDSEELQLHVVVHTQHKPFKCTECSLAFTRALYLTVHMRNVHTGEKPFKCSMCEMAYADARNLKIHLRKHTGERPFLCHQCGQSFADPCVLARHSRRHSGIKPYICVACGAKFTNSGSLQYHTRCHQGLKLHLCDECGMSFTSSSQLTEHQKTHLGLRPFACVDCGATFARVQNLKTHALSHSGQKPVRPVRKYTCEYCQAEYTDNRNFVRHVRVHTGEKPYSCNDCDKAFAQPGDLKKHRRIHTGEKPFSCSHCHARFRHSSGLTVHLRIHSGERPYKCEHCDSAFVSSSKLTSHVRSRHKTISSDA